MALPDRIDTIRLFVEKTLEQVQTRDDYKEFLELTLIFIGINPSRGVRFRKPEAVHHIC